jgi:hypothetical protein
MAWLLTVTMNNKMPILFQFGLQKFHDFVFNFKLFFQFHHPIFDLLGIKLHNLS